MDRRAALGDPSGSVLAQLRPLPGGIRFPGGSPAQPWPHPASRSGFGSPVFGNVEGCLACRLRSIPHIQFFNGRDSIRVEGVISSDPQPTGTAWRFPLSVQHVWIRERWHASHGDLLVVAKISPSLSSARDKSHFRYGDRLIVTGKAEEPPVFEDFDYRDYLARQGVFSTMVRPGVELVGEGEGNSLMQEILSIRNRLSRSLEQALPEPHNSMAQALLLGRRSTMPPGVDSSLPRHGGVPHPGHIGASRWGATGHLHRPLPVASGRAAADVSPRTAALHMGIRRPFRNVALGSESRDDGEHLPAGYGPWKAEQHRSCPCRGGRSHGRLTARDTLGRLVSAELHRDGRACPAGSPHRKETPGSTRRRR